jgi:hypothetical protein
MSAHSQRSLRWAGQDALHQALGFVPSLTAVHGCEQESRSPIQLGGGSSASQSSTAPAGHAA